MTDGTGGTGESPSAGEPDALSRVPAIDVAPHPSLDLGVLVLELPRPLAEFPSPPWLARMLSAPPEAPPSDAVRAAVRDLLRHGGYKPTGRGKPASEYLLRAVSSEEGLRGINLLVNLGNAISLESGLPVSVVDADRLAGDLSVRVADAEARYVFNPAGHEIAVGGLLCLHDAEGPCANAVKDSMRTKVLPETRHSLALIWGTRELEGLTERTLERYRELAVRAGLIVRT